MEGEEIARGVWVGEVMEWGCLYGEGDLWGRFPVAF